jgi:hypothetical protein
MRWLIAGLVLVFVASSAQAQMSPNSNMNATSQIGDHSRSTQSGEKDQKPKANDKAYNAALRNLPDKQYDPWHGVR